jgi:hypothetical protein
MSAQRLSLRLGVVLVAASALTCGSDAGSEERSTSGSADRPRLQVGDPDIHLPPPKHSPQNEPSLRALDPGDETQVILKFESVEQVGDPDNQLPPPKGPPTIRDQ